MEQTFVKQAFKKYLEQKKQATQNMAQTFSKPELKAIEKQEERAIQRRVTKRQRYANDPEYASQLRTKARESARKRREQKKIEQQQNPNAELVPQKKVKKNQEQSVQIQQVQQPMHDEQEEQFVNRKITNRKLF